ncbi:olfactory receptor 2AT4-like [Protopterus annectens]|uniref:olfactory receptor 2AT4-like n=1 Tax=Protopterus annectens TaxID=7888 RepID=UPI001CFBE916|nr:olfactory receptor 2AT4-like [Protopterus annectens]
MYFLLSNLAVQDIILSTITIPKMLAIFLVNSKTVSFNACFAQLGILHSLGVSEGFFLVVMAFDRYVAICSPLHYMSIMTKRVLIQMTLASWIIAFVIIVPPVILAAHLPFCGPDQVSNGFCDHFFVVRLACTDITLHTDLAFFTVMTLSLLLSSVVVFSYMKIIVTVLKINSAEGRKKAFSTCSSHLTVITTYYISGAITYSSYKLGSTSDEFHAFGTIFFTILTPTLNPFVYVLRNKEIKSAVKKILK